MLSARQVIENLDQFDRDLPIFFNQPGYNELREYAAGEVADDAGNAETVVDPYNDYVPSMLTAGMLSDAICGMDEEFLDEPLYIDFADDGTLECVMSIWLVEDGDAIVFDTAEL